MNTLLDEYLKNGLSDVVSIRNDEDEKGDWYGTENRTQEVVAKLGTKFIRAHGLEKHTFGPKGRHHASITNQREITREEYETLAADKPKLDSPQIRRELEERENGFAKARATRSELEAEAPKCPDHQTPMKLARGPKEYFFGCSRYPKCVQKKWLTTAQKSKAKQAPYLANVLD